MSSTKPLLDYLNAVHRYPLVAVCTFVVGCVLTLWTVRVLPNRYSSTTLIMVEAQQVPQSFVMPTVTDQLEQRLKALNQEVLSRTRLEGIIAEFGLYPKLLAEGTPLQQVVETMRSKIKIEVFSGNGFRITFEGDEPRVVQQVAARLATLYIDENLRSRGEHVAGTTEFIDNELQKAKHILEEHDAKIQAFKREHMGELPEQREVNMRTLGGLRTQLQTLSMALSAAKERKLLLEKQVADARTARHVTTGASGPTSGDPRLALQQLEAQLSDLRSRYKPEHPDVIRTQRKIEQLRADLTASGGGAPASVPVDPLVPPDLVRAVGDAELEVARLKAEQANTQEEIATYQARVENTFTREQQLLALTRDYGVTHQMYQTLLDKKLEAQLAQSLEERQKAERFRVLDPASLPDAPSKPNRRLLSLAGMAASLGLAVLLPILLAQLDTSFHLADELAAYSLPVFAVIPQANTLDVLRRRRRHRNRVLALTGFALAAGLSTVTLYARYAF